MDTLFLKHIYCIDIAHGNTEEWKGNGKRVERKKTSEWRAAIVGGSVLWNEFVE